MMMDYDEVRRFTAWTYGPAGEFAADEFMRLNCEHFAGSIPPLPIVIGITAYGHCIGLTRSHTMPRITLASELFNGSPRLPGGWLSVSDALVHEMVHAFLVLQGEDPDHNSWPWVEMITKLSPAVAGCVVQAAPVGTRRMPNPDRDTDPGAPKTKVVRQALPGYLTQKELSRWPHSLRPAGYYDGQRPIPVDAY